MKPFLANSLLFLIKVNKLYCLICRDGIKDYKGSDCAIVFAKKSV